MTDTIDLRDLNVDVQLRETYRLAGQITCSAVLAGELHDAENVERVRRTAVKLLCDIVSLHIDITGKHPGDPIYAGQQCGDE